MSSKDPFSRNPAGSPAIRSILALAGGVAATPLLNTAAEAAIIVDSTTFSGNHKTVDIYNRERSADLPGGSKLVFKGNASKNGTTSSFFVVASVQGTGARGFGRQARLASTNGASNAPEPAFQASKSANWNNSFRTGSANPALLIGNVKHSNPYPNFHTTVTTTTGGYQNTNFFTSTLVNSTFLQIGPKPFATPKYLLFTFQNNGTTDYGWVEVLSASSDSPFGTNVTLGRFAYQDDGTVINAGDVGGGSASVPEIDPSGLGSAAALVAGAIGLIERRRKRGAEEAMAGALVGGAAGLRQWRRQRAAQPNV